MTAITVPTPEVEAARELVRAHDAVRRDLMRARHRVSKMLLRYGVVYPESSTWTTRHRIWLSRQSFDEGKFRGTGVAEDKPDPFALEELQDQVCALGGDLVWSVEGPSPEDTSNGPKQRMREGSPRGIRGS